jgi:hypothetical protein
MYNRRLPKLALKYTSKGSKHTQEDHSKDGYTIGRNKPTPCTEEKLSQLRNSMKSSLTIPAIRTTEFLCFGTSFCFRTNYENLFILDEIYITQKPYFSLIRQMLNGT